VSHALSAAIPRLDLADMEPRLARALAPRVERLRYLGEFFRCMGHQPDALLGFIAFTESAKAGLDKKSVETIALTVATMKGNAYERNQHERLAVRLGFGRDWVRDVEALDPDAPSSLGASERRLQRFVIDTVKNEGHDVGPALDALVAEHGHEQAVAILMVIARYTTHALLVASLGLGPPVPSIFEDGFDSD
jgi:alkylhydroperoxidase family enzyme